MKESRPFILDYLHKQVGNALITCTLLLRPVISAAGRRKGESVFDS